MSGAEGWDTAYTKSGVTNLYCNVAFSDTSPEGM